MDDGGGVGFWAELYVVDAGDYETFYRNVPPVGPSAVAGSVPAVARPRRLGLSEGAAAPDDDPGEA